MLVPGLKVNSNLSWKTIIFSIIRLTSCSSYYVIQLFCSRKIHISSILSINASRSADLRIRVDYYLQLISKCQSSAAQFNIFVCPTKKFIGFTVLSSHFFSTRFSTIKTLKKPYISSIFALSIMCFSQQYHILTMFRHRKHIYRIIHHCLISTLFKIA